MLSNFDDCGWDASVYDIKTFCAKNDCSYTRLALNCQSSFFRLVDSFNSIAMNMAKFPAQTNELLYNQMEQMGEALGSIIKAVFNLNL